jgi:acetylornithine deacetylase/succinyl-diaminopimelate desuccinylase-like protein
MPDPFTKLTGLIPPIKAIQDIIITNIVLIGQTPAPTFKEKKRSKVFLERMAEFGVDECTTDGYRNPIAIVRGTDPDKPPIFLVAHLDTFYTGPMMYNYTVEQNRITGPGLLDNSLGVGVLLSMPEILGRLGIRLQSDLVMAGTIQSIGKGNLRGVRHLLKTWPTQIRGGICLEGVELGRLNYSSNGMVRGEIECRVAEGKHGGDREQPNAILMANEIINKIMKLKLPQRPLTRVVVGKMAGGADHGRIAAAADLGFEIRSDSYRIVKSTLVDIQDIVADINRTRDARVKLKTISNLKAARLKYNHPLVKAASRVMETLGITPVSKPTESALSIFLARGVPAVTLGITHGNHHYSELASMEIEPMFTGIAQIIGVLQAIDNGVCDEHGMAR